jgi:dsRNA-specific ribonuclease
MNSMEKSDDDISDLTFTPYNMCNKEISLSQVQTILSNYGVQEKATDIELYRRAFTHQSYCMRPLDQKIQIAPCPPHCMPIQEKSNERLEFLGDGVLECVTKFYMYRRFTRENEGFMTEKKIALVKNESIGSLALQMGLSEWYILSRHSEDKKLRTNLKKLGCLFEAFLGAIFVDFKDRGFQVAQTFIEHVYEKHIDWTELILCDDNYKNILQVKLQKEFKTTPEYLEIGHNGCYHMGVYLCLGQPIWKTSIQKAIPFSHFETFEKIHAHLRIHSQVLIFLGEGRHKIKKKSEQLACEQALQTISKK